MVLVVDYVPGTWGLFMIILFSTNGDLYYLYRLFSLSLTEYYLFFCRRYSARLVVLLIVSHLEILLMHRTHPSFCCPFPRAHHLLLSFMLLFQHHLPTSIRTATARSIVVTHVSLDTMKLSCSVGCPKSTRSELCTFSMTKRTRRNGPNTMVCTVCHTATAWAINRIGRRWMPSKNAAE